MSSDKLHAGSVNKGLLVKTGSVGGVSAPKGRSIHTLCTSNGSPYLNYQTRIM